MYVKDIVSLWLQRLGVKQVFGIPGSYVLPLIDSITRHSIQFILSQHEYGAALMADGYAKASGRVACVVTTTGIGATNALSGIYNSYSDSQPVIFLTGQVPVGQFGKGALQECVGIGRTLHIERLFQEVTKYSKLVTAAEDVLDALLEAEYQMLEGRKGPVHLCIPIDILQTKIPFEQFLVKHQAPVKPIHEGVIVKLDQLLQTACKPLLLLGAGCQSEMASKLATSLADYGIPIATTLRGKGIVNEKHPAVLGCVGMYGESAANYYLNRQADLIIAVGVSMSEFTTQCWDPAIAKPPLVHVDIDASQFGRNYTATLDIQSDAVHFLGRLFDRVQFLPAGCWDEVRSTVESAKARFLQSREVVMPLSREQGKLHPAEAVIAIQQQLPVDRTVWVSDSVTWTETNLKLSGANRHIEAVNQASIGYTPAAAIGVKHALPDQLVVAVFGDGGFRQSAMELATAASYRTPVLWVILNNGKYGSIYAAQKSYYDGNIVGSTYSPIDFVQLGTSMGVDSYLIENIEQLKEAILSFVQNERPVLLDVRIDESLPSAKARQLVRYQQWKLNKPTREHIVESDILSLKQLMMNRY